MIERQKQPAGFPWQLLFHSMLAPSMSRCVALTWVEHIMKQVVEFGRRGVTHSDLSTYGRSVQLQSEHDYNIQAPNQGPVSIHINLGRQDDEPREKRSFSIMGSKLFWLTLTIAISVSMAYYRTRLVCQGFKDTGRFYYGMDVDRCMSIVRGNPLTSVENMLDSVNKSY